MGVITDINEARGLVAIYADGRLLIRLRKKHFDKKPLSVGDCIDSDRYIDSISAIQSADAYEAALTLLDFSTRTGEEIRRGLIRKGYTEPAADSVVARLTEAGLIDDRHYAARIVENASHKSVGFYSVRRKLMAKGISEDDADAVLSALDDGQQLSAARAAAAKLAHKYADLEPRQARSKLSQALARRGFSWDVISAALESADDDYDV
jgi:regulatory protein